MHIEHATINIHLASGIEGVLLNTDSAAKVSAGACTPPAIGGIWPGQGGIYAGLSRGRDGQADGHLILHVTEAPSKLNLADAQKWAEGIEVEGHTDFHVATNVESALLYANLKDLFDPAGWYWTSTQYAGNEGYAWLQYFGYGYQNGLDKSYAGRVRAVRRFAA